MPTLTATEARSKLYRLIDEAASSHEPIFITGKRGSAVLISEDANVYISPISISGSQKTLSEAL